MSTHTIDVGEAAYVLCDGFPIAIAIHEDAACDIAVALGEHEERLNVGVRHQYRWIRWREVAGIKVSGEPPAKGEGRGDG